MASQQSNVREIEHSKRVRAMFAGIADRYDLLNHLLSGNTDKRWRRVVVKTLKLTLTSESSRVLDVACGTGDLALMLNRDTNASVVGTDFCRPMLDIAQRKSNIAGAKRIQFVEGDALRLPFSDSTFDALTIAFGLRNLSNVDAGLKELLRVLKPGGMAVILEFSTPVVPGFRKLFQFYFARVLPRIGGLVSGSRPAYEYLPDSVSRFPDQETLVRMMRDIGFAEVEYKNLTGGVAAMHIGRRPSEL